jgi:signal transduction histidine kinase
MQRSARRVAVDVGQQPAVLEYLKGVGNDRRALFAAVSRAADANECGVEVYDLQAELAAWSGPSGPSVRREVRIGLDGQMTSMVARTPVASQLFVASPVRSDGKIVGAVVTRQTVELHYPLSNRFIARMGLADRLGEQLGTLVEFDFSADAQGRKDGRWLVAPLKGIDDRRVGAVSIMRPARSAVIEQIQTGFTSADCILLFCLFLAGVTLPAQWLVRERRSLRGALGLVAVIWSTRYLLLWLELPGRLFAQGIFDPALYASEFGGGLARSIGDCFLSAAAFAFSMWILGSADAARPSLRERKPGGSGVLVRLAGAAVITFLLFWTLRGLGAVVRSALYDSTLSFGDPGIVIPPFPMALMLLTLGVLSGCMGLFGVWITRHLHAILGRGRMAVGVILALYTAAAILFGIAQDEPLMSTPFRLIAGGAWILVALWRPKGRAHAPFPQIRDVAGVSAAIVAGLSLLFLVPLLQGNIEEHARSRVETFAAEFLRPVDGWLKFIVDDGLRQLQEAADTPGAEKDEPAVRDDLALSAWARSAACREGYSTLFAVLDTTGHELGRFAIGSQAALVSQFADGLPLDSTGKVRVKNIGDGISAVRVYGSTTQLHPSAGQATGYARVVIAAGEQQLFRGDNPEVLRKSAEEPLESFYRPITLSEYRDGLLLRTTNAQIPYTHLLSDDIRTILNRPESPTVWSTETIGDATFESYSVRRAADSHDVIVMSMEQQPLLLRTVGLVKIPMVYILLAVLAGLGFVIVLWVQGKRYMFTFRDRLLASMLLTAFVPLCALLLYGQYAVRHRVMESLSHRLEDETASIAQEIAGIGEYADVSTDLTLRPDRVELIASNVGTDFNVYTGNDLRISSRPELYTTGLLDSRLNGRAYAAVVLEGRRFHLESEHVGLYQYEVGYRAILDAAGGVIGIVGVPTIFRQDEVDRELSERNAVLFGVYAVVLLSIVIVTTVLANRIAAPVHQLTALTRDVARGTLDIASRLPRAEGEIGELVQAFETMARELRRSRDELVEAERELAWREMARQIAHEIKNPLTPMKLSVQHLRQTYRDHAPGFDAILDQVTRTVIEQIDALSRIASEFSSFARMPRRRLEPCAVDGIVREAVMLFRQDKGIRFHLESDAALPVVQADRDELRRAFINIIRNGVQAMGGDGSMEITIRQSLKGVAITIADHGVGIPEEVRPRLFQPNFSTKTDGMGLGLAIVKKTLDDLGATIEIESAPGHGTTVRIDMPAGKEGVQE